MSGKSKKYTDIHAPLGEGCAYGRPEGLQGPNCTHMFYPFWEGISEIPEPLKEPEPVKYKGRIYTRYEATQQMRAMEREIRALKREKYVAEDATKLNQINAKIKANKAEYMQFSEAMRLKPKENRILVGGERSPYAKPKTYKEFSSGEEVNSYFKPSEDKWVNSLTESEKKAINGYTGTDFAKINSNLRAQDQDDSNTNESIANIDNAISKFSLDDNIAVYRVVDRNGIKNIDINNCVGEIYNDEAYMSTSPVYRGVLDGVDDSFTVFKINVPKGKGNGAYINSLSQYQDAEYEFLLKRNTKCRILKVKEIDDKKLLEMEVILDD